MTKQKVIEGTAWYDHAGYGMCLLPKGPSVQGLTITIEAGDKQLLPNEWHGMKVRITMEVIDNHVSDEHKKFYDHALLYKPEPRWEDEEKANFGTEELRKEFRERLYGEDE